MANNVGLLPMDNSGNPLSPSRWPFQWTTQNIAAGAFFTSPWYDSAQFLQLFTDGSFQGFLGPESVNFASASAKSSSQPLTLYIEQSDDKNNITFAYSVPVVATGLNAINLVQLAARYFRVRVQNTGAGADANVTISLVAEKLDGPASVTTLGGTLQVDLTATSPAAAGAVAQAAVLNLGVYRSLFIYAKLTGATAGTLDIYLQGSPDAGATMVDYAHFPQLAAAAAAIERVWTASKSQQQTTLQTVGSGLTPALPVNTIIGGDWGDRLRVAFVAGAGTTAGAQQIIKLSLTT